ncbi:hypothetical protein [Enterococcus casseliflavus]|uniref:hypothetical protein n=1 Tax=Enterococcus casseliflavus TaxID=37734 RepID=UPI0012E0E620|nr:hypothetical protein [Enterococcus casseliflavus]MUN75568.1 hypothetical protein [Enterococcus casseliflavus]MUN97939.1 hypothetical protein [Enterococcus casseliflavus]
MKINQLIDPSALFESLRDFSSETTIKSTLDTKSNISSVLLNEEVPSEQVLSLTDDSSVKEVIHQQEPDIICKLFKENLYESFSVESDKFTNFLPEEYLITENTLEQITSICTIKNCLCINYDNKEAPPVIYSGRHKERIKNILSYFQTHSRCEENELIDAFYDARIRKSTIANGHEKGSLRLISLYQKKGNQTFFYFLFADVHHLFVPSNYLGYDSEKQIKSTFNNHKNNPTSISKLISKEDFKWE